MTTTTENGPRDAVAERADGGACGVCGRPDAAHCQECWHCPGTHDECCGW